MNQSAPGEPRGLEETFFLTNWARWQRMLPWLGLFRVPRLALSFKSMLFALLAAWCLIPLESLVQRSLGPEFHEAYEKIRQRQYKNSEEQITIDGARLEQAPWGPLTRLLYQEKESFSETEDPFRIIDDRVPLSQTRERLESWSVANPVSLVTLLLNRLFLASEFRQVGQVWFWSISLLLFWGIWGGPICRVAALEWARGLPPTFRELSQGLLRRFLSYLGALVIPALLIVGLIICATGLSWLGALVLPSFLAIGFALFTVVLANLLIIGWPGLIAAINVDADDCFDATSRVFNYGWQQFKYLLFLLVILFLLGLGVSAVWSFFIEQAAQLVANQNPAYQRTLGEPFWHDFYQVLHWAYPISFFWTSVTAIYFLLRKSEDGVPVHELPVSASTTEEIPFVGLAGMAQQEKKQAEKTSQKEPTESDTTKSSEEKN